MKVYIANLGTRNYLWPTCQARGTIAVINEVGVHEHWLRDDREAYIEACLRRRTVRGIAPTKSVASKWFNQTTIVAQTSGDLWIHKAEDRIWWTISKSDPPTFEPSRDEHREYPEVIACHKRCEPWSNLTRNGNPLSWGSLHPKAREFLFTEGTLQQLGEDNASFAVALISGDDLRPWLSRREWVIKAQSAKSGAASEFNPRQISIVRMASTAAATVASANGQTVLRTVKEKTTSFSNPALESYIDALIDAQEGLCAITGIALHYDGPSADPELLCSLDRIDSSKGYKEGNIQVVCRFINRWKKDDDDEAFRRLIGVVRETKAV